MATHGAGEVRCAIPAHSIARSTPQDARDCIRFPLKFSKILHSRLRVVRDALRGRAQFLRHDWPRTDHQDRSAPICGRAARAPCRKKQLAPEHDARVSGRWVRVRAMLCGGGQGA